MPLSPIERAIAAVSPEWAARRAYWRSTLESGLRAYEAAKTGRRTQGWITSGTSANAEIGAAAATLRARARDLVRNNPYAVMAVRKLAAKVVGAGIVPRLDVPSGELDRKRLALAEWNAFVEASDPEGVSDFYGQLHVATRAMFESGEALVRFIPRPASWKLRVPLQIQVMEGDWLDSEKTEPLKDGGAIIQGVEYEASGRRAAYWLFDEHPGETYSFARRSLQSRRVPAAEILHLFERLRPGQARGMTAFAAVALRAQDVDDVADSKRWQQKVAAAFAAFVKSPDGPAKSQLAAASETDAAGRRVEAIAPGTIKYLKPDEEVTFLSPPSVEGYLDYMVLELRAIAAGIGIPYEQMTGDLSQTNYSSIRAGTVDFHDLLDCWQWLTVIPQVCRPVWNRVGNLLVALGRRAPGDYRALWAPPRRRFVDPVKEVEGVREEIRAGTKLWDEAVAEQGFDPDEQAAAIANRNVEFDRYGLVLDIDPRRVARASTPANPKPGDSADEKAKAARA